MDVSSYPVLFSGYDDSNLNDETWTFGGGDIPLAVTLNSFKAIKEQDRIILNWRTESEIKNKCFLIDKSLNGEIYYLLATIDGNSYLYSTTLRTRSTRSRAFRVN
jgi:hypothetical protein